MTRYLAYVTVAGLGVLVASGCSSGGGEASVQDAGGDAGRSDGGMDTGPGDGTSPDAAADAGYGGARDAQTDDAASTRDGGDVGDAAMPDAARIDAATDAGRAGKACSDDEDCGEGMFCVTSTCSGVGSCTGDGFCRVVPDFCTDVYDPVCGCDGVTYGNCCEAAAAEQSVAHEGDCESY